MTAPVELDPTLDAAARDCCRRWHAEWCPVHGRRNCDGEGSVLCPVHGDRWCHWHGIVPVEVEIDRLDLAVSRGDGETDDGHHYAVICDYLDEEGRRTYRGRTFTHRADAENDLAEIGAGCDIGEAGPHPHYLVRRADVWFMAPRAASA